MPAYSNSSTWNPENTNKKIQMDPKPVSKSRTVMTELIMPNDTNPLGNLMGGNLMRWMDIAAGICAAKHCEAHCVTVSVDHVSFKKPIMLGSVITITASVTRAFNTSVEVFIKVETGSVVSDSDASVSNNAYMTFVALDPYTQRPKSIPKVLPETDEEKELFESAIHRREIRLILAGKLKTEEAVEIKALFTDKKRND